MKVPNNSLNSMRVFFYKELAEIYNRNELQIIWDSLCESFVPHNKSSNDKISESEILRFLYGIKKLKNLCPYQYVSGFADFYNLDRKSTRLNSSHVKISYAVFCLKKK